MQAGLSASLLAERLRLLLNRAASVSRARRFGLIAACGAFPLLGVTFMLIYAGFTLMQTRLAPPRAPAPPTLSQCLTALSLLETNRNLRLPGGLDGRGTAYSGTLLGPGLIWNGTPFKFGPTNAADVVAAIGQTITLPPGHFTNLALLATAVNGTKISEILTLTYADDTSSRWTQGFSDWFTPRNFLRESNALAMDYRNHGRGGQDDHRFYLYGYAFPLDSNRTVRSLTLPGNSEVKVLALTLEPPATTVDLSPSFNQVNGIVADGSPFAADNHGLIEAFEVYISGRFGQTIRTAPTFTNFARTMVPPSQEAAARQVIARRPSPTENELNQATAMVDAYLYLGGGPLNIPILSNAMVLLAMSGWPLVALGAIPSLAMALLFRGGLILRMLGLAVVNEDGTEASRLRVFWRNLIAWFPALLSGPLVALLVGPAGGLAHGLSVGTPTSVFIVSLTAASFCCIMLTAMLVVCFALLPERGLQDQLAGTWLVPRE
jgi:hypothetical protein